VSGSDQPDGPGGPQWPENPEEMARPWRPRAGFRGAGRGGATARFAAEEAVLIRSLVSQLAELMGGEDSGEPDNLEELLSLSDNVRPPDDPVLARLLPDAYRDDPAAAGEFRRYTESSLKAGKVAAARTVLATLPEGGGRVRLSADDAQAWLRALNDVRLALGVRLEVTEDWEEMLERLRPEDPRAAGLWVYDWLTLLQETLVEALW
jgi:hypothetical protein